MIMSTTMRTNINASLIEEEHVSIEKKKECLQTGVYDVLKRSPFMGSVLQCLDIYYTHAVPRAGIMFDTQGKKWNMAINPKWFCEHLDYKMREGVLLHEIFHVTHKHPMRAPFLKINQHRRMLMNIAMDMAINQYIQNLPKGCPTCPPIEEQYKGAACTNNLCPGSAIFVENYFDTDKNGKQIPWPKEKPMEFYYHKLIEKYDQQDKGREPTMRGVEHVVTDPETVSASGYRESKTLTSAVNESITKFKSTLTVGQAIVFTNQVDSKENGIHQIVDVGSPTTPWVVKRHVEHSGTIVNSVYVGDAAIDKHQVVKKGQKKKGWFVVGRARAKDSNLVEVDKAEIIFQEEDLEEGSGPGQGGEFDSHQWDGNAEESEMMDATEDLVKRAMQKRGLTYDKLPGFIQELLQDIDARRNELNYRQLILAAIKKHASGFNREHSWTRPSRRFKNKAPGTRNGHLPSILQMIDSSGSISVQEANDFLDITDEFMKVGSRKCDLALWHTNVYYHEQYKLGNRIDAKTWQSGGTDVGPVLRKIYEEQKDLNIIMTDGCFCDVDYESWLKPGEHFPQVLWIISRDGSEEHPIKRLGETIKIPNTEVMKRDQKLEQS